MIIWASSISNSAHRVLQLAIGGTLLGAGASQLTSIFINDDLVQFLSTSLTGKFQSKPSDLDAARKQYHHYHMTDMEGVVWRHALIDFRKCPEVSRLFARVT